MNIAGEWIVVCERVIHDALTENLTLVSCLERVGALHFPATHANFGIAARYRCLDGAPPTPVDVHFRLVRVGEDAPEEELMRFVSSWGPGATRFRMGTNFQLLRLNKPELLTFRIDHSMDGAKWNLGPSCTLDVVRMKLTPQEREAMREQLIARGLPTDDLDAGVDP